MSPKNGPSYGISAIPPTRRRRWIRLRRSWRIFRKAEERRATIKERFGKYREITFETAADLNGLVVPEGAILLEKDERRLSLRFDRMVTSASRVSAAVMSQIEVLDLSLTEPDLSLVVKQIYLGGLKSDSPAVV